MYSWKKTKISGVGNNNVMFYFKNFDHSIFNFLTENKRIPLSSP